LRREIPTPDANYYAAEELWDLTLESSHTLYADPNRRNLIAESDRLKSFLARQDSDVRLHRTWAGTNDGVYTMEFIGLTFQEAEYVIRIFSGDGVEFKVKQNEMTVGRYDKVIYDSNGSQVF